MKYMMRETKSTSEVLKLSLKNNIDEQNSLIWKAKNLDCSSLVEALESEPSRQSWRIFMFCENFAHQKVWSGELNFKNCPNISLKVVDIVKQILRHFLAFETYFRK